MYFRIVWLYWKLEDGGTEELGQDRVTGSRDSEPRDTSRFCSGAKIPQVRTQWLQRQLQDALA